MDKNYGKSNKDQKTRRTKRSTVNTQEQYYIGDVINSKPLRQVEKLDVINIQGVSVTISRNIQQSSIQIERMKSNPDLKIHRQANKQIPEFHHQQKKKKTLDIPDKINKKSRSKDRIKKTQSPDNYKPLQVYQGVNKQHPKLDYEYYSRAPKQHKKQQFSKCRQSKISGNKVTANNTQRSIRGQVREFQEQNCHKNKTQQIFDFNKVQEPNKLKFDSTKGVIGFDGKLTKTKPNSKPLQRKKLIKNNSSHNIYSEYLSCEMNSKSYRKKQKLSKQKKHIQNKMKDNPPQNKKLSHSKSRKSTSKKKKSTSKKQAQTENKTKYNKNQNSRKKMQPSQQKTVTKKHIIDKSAHSTTNIQQHDLNNPQFNLANFDITELQQLLIYGGQIMNIKTPRNQKSPSSNYMRIQKIEDSQIKRQIAQEASKYQHQNIYKFCKNMHSQHQNAIIGSMTQKQQSQKIQDQETNNHCYTFRQRAKSINLISKISGAMAYKQQIFALTVLLLDTYYSIVSPQEQQQKQMSTSLKLDIIPIKPKRKNKIGLKNVKIVAITCLLLTLKLERTGLAQIFMEHITYITEKQKQQQQQIQKDKQLQNQMKDIQGTSNTKNNRYNVNSQRKRTKTKNTCAVSATKDKGKDKGKDKSNHTNLKKETSKRKKQLDKLRDILIHIQGQKLYDIFGNQLVIIKEQILQLQTEIYLKLNTRIYKKTYAYWLNLLTSYWDQHIFELKSHNIDNKILQKQQLLLFRYPSTSRKYRQLSQILESCLYFPEQFYSYNSSLLVISCMYILLIITMQANIAHHQHQYRDQQEELLEIFQTYRKNLAKSHNYLFFDKTGINVLFGELLIKLELKMADILNCCQFISKFFYHSPLVFNWQYYQKKYIQDIYQRQFTYSQQNNQRIVKIENKEISSQDQNQDDKLSFHAYNSELYIFFGRFMKN